MLRFNQGDVEIEDKYFGRLREYEVLLTFDTDEHADGFKEWLDVKGFKLFEDAFNENADT